MTKSEIRINDECINDEIADRRASWSPHRCIVVLLFAILVLTNRARALAPEEILLIVNKNLPDSRPLADFYANARGVPRENIVGVALPFWDEIPFDTYERDVVPAIRRFMREGKLEGKIKCLVTFYGMPLRIGARIPAGQEREEFDRLARERAVVSDRIATLLDAIEKEAGGKDSSFKPKAGNTADQLAVRIESAFAVLAAAVDREKDPAKHAEEASRLVERMRDLGGPASVVRTFTPVLAKLAPEQRAKIEELSEHVKKATTQIGVAQELRFDADARALLRKLSGDTFGLIELIRIQQAQMEYLKPEKSGAALDSELSMLWWNLYPRTAYHPNPLSFHYLGKLTGVPQTLMVMRLDAPMPGQVREMILMGLKAERDGLKGKMVLDSRSIDAQGANGRPGGYGWYDQSIRNLAEIMRTKTKMQVLHDVSPEVLAPNSAADVALYCGWYSVRNYVPACRFNMGAVGFHIASFELVRLRGDDEKGWVRGLINDGVVATMGPVDEPYLTAFAPADEFFPLLLTGKLPLAEVHWRTTPFTSWMISMIGDPLYTPYLKNPQIAVDDLPERLRVVFKPVVEGAATTKPTR